MTIILFLTIVFLWFLCGFTAAVLFRCNEKKEGKFQNKLLDDGFICFFIIGGLFALFVVLIDTVSFRFTFFENLVEKLANKCAGVKR